MNTLSRRNLMHLGLAGLGLSVFPKTNFAAETNAPDVHRQLLEVAEQQQRARRARFAAVQSPTELAGLQRELQAKFLRSVGGLPEPMGVPPSQKLGQIEAEEYVIEKLVFESFPGYFVPALLYRPKQAGARRPGVISPCGHSTEGKAAASYQMLHINLVRRGYVVLTYDPVGQAERSQFWDAEKKKSRYNLTCGEHAVLGNPLYLLNSSLARYRVWDGIRALDYLASRDEVDSERLGCAGNSGGGTLTAYIAALDPRVKAAAICCYITTLPRRMGNRIQADPDADPEQDLFGFVGEEIDHAGLLALRAPRPTLLGTARDDFFPIEGARESFAEAQRLFGIAGMGERIARVEAPERHGLSLPLRTAVYAFFDQWLAGPGESTAEFAVTPRPARELLVCAQGQVNLSLKSRHLLPLALEHFDGRVKPQRVPLRELLRIDAWKAAPLIEEIAPDNANPSTTVLCVNGNETSDWREDKPWLQSLAAHGYSVAIVDLAGTGKLRPDLSIKGHDYADPLAGVEENIAYNAFLVGQSLAGIRVADLLAAVEQMAKSTLSQRIVLCARRDAALIVCLVAALERKITHVAAEGLLVEFRSLFSADASPINAASIVPGLLAQYGDMAEVLTDISPRKVLLAASDGQLPRLPSVQSTAMRFTTEIRVLTDWLSAAS